MTKVKRLGAVLFAVCAFAASVAPAAFADPGGGPGGATLAALDTNRHRHRTEGVVTKSSEVARTARDWTAGG